MAQIERIPLGFLVTFAFVAASLEFSSASATSMQQKDTAIAARDESCTAPEAARRGVCGRGLLQGVVAASRATSDHPSGHAHEEAAPDTTEMAEASAEAEADASGGSSAEAEAEAQAAALSLDAPGSSEGPGDVYGVRRTVGALRLELHLRYHLATLHQKFGPLPLLVQQLQQALRDATGLRADRLSFLGIRGEPVNLLPVDINDEATLSAALMAVEAVEKRRTANTHPASTSDSQEREPEAGNGLDASELDFVTDDDGGATSSKIEPSQVEPAKVASEESAPPLQGRSIVDFEIMPGQASDPTPIVYLSKLREQLRAPSGPLKTGDLAAVLAGARVVGGPKEDSEEATVEEETASPESSEEVEEREAEKSGTAVTFPFSSATWLVLLALLRLMGA